MPTTFLSLLLFVILLAPGQAYTLLRERTTAQNTISTLRETAQLVLVSVLADTAVLCAFALLRASAPGLTPDVGGFIRSPSDYATTHYRQVSAWAAGLLIAAVLLACLAAGGRAHRLAQRLTSS